MGPVLSPAGIYPFLLKRVSCSVIPRYSLITLFFLVLAFHGDDLRRILDPSPFYGPCRTVAE
jgi:hypothetical protein